MKVTSPRERMRPEEESQGGEDAEVSDIFLLLDLGWPPAVEWW